MNPFYDFINNLYTNKEYEWISNFEDKVNGIGLISVLAKDDDSLVYLKKISKYIYVLRHDFLLIYLHSVIPKRYKAPWIKYYKKKKEDKVDSLHKRVQKYFGYSSKEYSYIKGGIDYFVRKDLDSFYKKFGIV